MLVKNTKGQWYEIDETVLKEKEVTEDKALEALALERAEKRKKITDMFSKMDSYELSLIKEHLKIDKGRWTGGINPECDCSDCKPDCDCHDCKPDCDCSDCKADCDCVDCSADCDCSDCGADCDCTDCDPDCDCSERGWDWGYPGEMGNWRYQGNIRAGNVRVTRKLSTSRPANYSKSSYAGRVYNGKISTNWRGRITGGYVGKNPECDCTGSHPECDCSDCHPECDCSYQGRYAYVNNIRNARRYYNRRYI